MWLLIGQNTSDNTRSPFPDTPPCTKVQSRYCESCERSYLNDKCYQNRLTVTVKSKLVCECRQLCRNCRLLWLHILSLNATRHSAISVTTSSHQSVLATSLRSSLASFHTDLCTFCLIREARKSLNSVVDISNTYEPYMWTANMSIVWSNRGLEYWLCTCGTRVHVFREDHILVGNLLSTFGSAELSRIRFMLFRIIMLDTIQSLVQKVCRTELDIVHLVAAFGLNLFNNLRYAACPESKDTSRVGR